MLIEERSPPNAPKAPPIASNLAVPLGLFVNKSINSFTLCA
jgi:hypothetical protein